jgi:ribosomal protein L35AE/L33A
MSLRYDDEYEVELYDQVEIDLGNRWEPRVVGGVVTRLHPRSSEVTVRYEDNLDFRKRDGEPKRKSVRVPIATVMMIRRDG